MYNYSYHILVGIFLQPVATYRPVFFHYKTDNNVAPRGNLEYMKASKRYNPATIAKIERLQAAERNSWDGLPIICAAIVAGNTAGLTPEYLNTAAGLYLLSRIVYVWLYATVSTRGRSYLRSLTWWFGNLCSIVTLVKAGRALNATR